MRFWLPFSHTSIAGSCVTFSNRSWNEPVHDVRKSWFCFSINDWLLTVNCDVANQSCQISVIRSTNGWLPRTMRSSHQRWSCPIASLGASGLPLESCGSGPTAAYAGGSRSD